MARSEKAVSKLKRYTLGKTLGKKVVSVWTYDHQNEVFGLGLMLQFCINQELSVSDNTKFVSDFFSDQSRTGKWIDNPTFDIFF